MFEPETLGLCVCLSMEKEQQRLSLEGCGAAGTSETKKEADCISQMSKLSRSLLWNRTRRTAGSSNEYHRIINENGL